MVIKRKACRQRTLVTCFYLFDFFVHLAYIFAQRRQSTNLSRQDFFILRNLKLQKKIMQKWIVLQFFFLLAIIKIQVMDFVMRVVDHEPKI